MTINSGQLNYLELLPAVDVKDGKAVRLVQGELAQESIYGAPLEVALEFQAAGAQWLHLVDLDAAFGRGENTSLLAGGFVPFAVIVDDEGLAPTKSNDK